MVTLSQGTVLNIWTQGNTSVVTIPREIVLCRTHAAMPPSGLKNSSQLNGHYITRAYNHVKPWSYGLFEEFVQGWRVEGLGISITGLVPVEDRMKN